MKTQTRVLLIEDSEEDRVTFRRAIGALNKDGNLGVFEFGAAGTL